jgi:hypothetical protein
MIASGGIGNLPGYMKETTDISRHRNTPIPSQDKRLTSPPWGAAGSRIFSFSCLLRVFCFIFLPVYLFTLATESSCHDNLAIDRPDAAFPADQRLYF